MMDRQGSGTAINPNRNSKFVVQGVEISGEMLWYNPVAFPVGTKLFLTEAGAIMGDPQVFATNPPEVQLLGTVVTNGFIHVTPKRLPALL